jgi:hypothetical protein
MQQQTPSRLANFPALIEEVRFARDSPLEGDGFEPSVPLGRDMLERLRSMFFFTGGTEDSKPSPGIA